MYAVVGCDRCSALWVVEGRPETSECPRCGRRRQYAKRRKFVETEDADRAREARARLLADREDSADAVEDFAAEEREAMAAGPDDREFLEASGVDPDAVAAAGERVDRGGDSRSRKEVVLDALRALDEPTAEDVVGYAAEAGVPEGYARDALEKLVRRGDVTESDGGYRLL